MADLGEGLLASATYDGDLHLAVLKFYDAKKGRFWLWRDNTGHKPYCVPGDTILLGDNKTIAEVSEGDHVLGLTGEVGVAGKSVRQYDGDMVRIRACGLLPFSVTPEHPVLIARLRKPRPRAPSSEFRDRRWICPTDLRPTGAACDGDYVVMPIARANGAAVSISLSRFTRMRSGWLKVREFPLNEETAWLLGLYVAEGSFGGRRGAAFSLNKRERIIQAKVMAVAKTLGYSAHLVSNGPRSVRVHLGGAVMARAMDAWCGHGATNKRIPDFVLFHSNLNILRSFLEGYLTGDGSDDFTRGTASKRKIQVMCSVSRLLAFQLQQAFARLGIFAHISVQHAAGPYQIEGRVVEQHEAYTIRFIHNPKYTRAKRVGDCFYTPITGVERRRFRGPVYNIQTDDNTFLVSNVVVHNCYTKQPREELRDISDRKDVTAIVDEEKLDLLTDQTIKVRKIVTKDPLAIGGGNDSIRDKITAWEADIKYYENYAYDKGLKMGTYYSVSGGKVSPLKHDMPANVAKSLESLLAKNPPEFLPYLKEWAELLGEPLADFRRIALDIEVANEAGRLPDTDDPKQKVTAVSFVGDAEKTVYLLKDGKDAASLQGSPFAYRVFDDEPTLLRAAFSKMMDYPVIVTFNGDDFDLRYLQHRAEKLGIKEEENPIQLERVAAALKHGVHVDLYQFFRNRSIQVYAFSNKYSEHTLNGISEALLGRSKVEFEGEIGDLPLTKLAEYCLNDSQLTYDLTSMGGSVVMKLLLVISRIGKMPMNDVSRLGVSNWIRSMLFFEHRKINALIPRQDELNEKGGASSQAVIKGKKYKGGFVVEPKPGVYFDVAVLDFASLYPSLIKVHNLSYETVNCPHEECKSNTIPDTSSWVCTKRKGIVSLVTGSLRDLRVAHYKPLAKEPSLSKDEHGLYNVVTQGLKVFLNACFTGDTYVITPEGLKNIKDFRVGDKVINVNPESLAAEIDEVVEVQKFPYSGDMYHFRDRHFMDLQVTPNHRFLTLDRRRSSRTGTQFLTAEEVYSRSNVTIPALKSPLQSGALPKRVSLLESAKEVDANVLLYPGGVRLSNWFRRLSPELRAKVRRRGSVRKTGYSSDRTGGSRYILPASFVDEGDIDEVETAGGFAYLQAAGGAKIPARYDSAAFAELSGWFVSEGALYETLPREYANGHVRGHGAGLTITQEQGKGNQNGVLYRKDIARLMASLGLRASTDSANSKYFKVASRVLHRWVRDNCYVGQGQPHTAREKRIPAFVFESVDSMQGFLDAVYSGDGSSRQTLYSTASKHLAEGLVVLLTSLGAKTKMVWDHGIFRVSFNNSSTKLTYSGTTRHTKISKFSHEGNVYCITTKKNHTVFAGRNGKFVPVGQSYGVLGFETFAFYCLPVAEATAALGRDAITRTIARCKELGIEVLYGDTDSIFLKSPSKEQVSTIMKWASADLGVDLDLDKNYRYVAFSSRKKNYFGVLPDGTVDIKGLTGRKSQTPEYLKKTFYETLDILSQVQTEGDFESARKNIRSLLTNMITSIKGKKVPVADLAFTVMMGKPTNKYNGTTPQHVRAAMQLEKNGEEVKAGEIIAYVKTKSPPYVKPSKLARPDEIDADKYIDYAHSMFDQLLDSLDFSFDEIMGATTLDLFWSS